MNHKVLKETMQAYADCWTDAPHEATAPLRNLSFRASEPITRDEAIEIMSIAVPGYNEFRPDLIGKLPPGCKITLARESSVCIYVKPHPVIAAGDLDEDELDKVNGETRIWWD